MPKIDVNTTILRVLFPTHPHKKSLSKRSSSKAIAEVINLILNAMQTYIEKTAFANERMKTDWKTSCFSRSNKHGFTLQGIRCEKGDQPNFNSHEILS